MEELTEKLNSAQNAEDSGKFFNAAFLYKEALNLARNLGKSDVIKKCKKKIPEMNRKMKNDMQKFSIEQKISEEDIMKVVNHFLNKKDVILILQAIGVEPILYPNFQKVINNAHNSMPVSYHIASLSTISEEGHLLKGGDKGVKSWEMTIYEQTQTIILQVYLVRLFYELIEKDIINREVISNYLKQTGFFSKSSFEIIKTGIERYFAEDYISSLHILVPQFEGLFLHLSEKLGLDVIALNSGKSISTKTRTLSPVFLSTEEAKKIWGEDLCEQLKFLLFEPLGYKLRHKVAHGEIKLSECNFGTTSLMLYLYLVLTARVVRKENKTA